MKKNLVFVLIVNLLTAGRLWASDVPVSSIADLQNAINKAVSGDVITVANGTYTTTADIIVNKKGTAKQPIIITAQTIGGAEIGGTGGFTIVSPAAYIVIR